MIVSLLQHEVLLLTLVLLDRLVLYGCGSRTSEITYYHNNDNSYQ
jgi:hypothetical protein